ncbi:MAG: hypothetical protein LBR33_01265 [Propionibacteriaceae bacterium]|jgi:glycosidase|nr:hypothetical protein [Propionibacteriaceae bacterium]
MKGTTAVVLGVLALALAACGAPTPEPPDTASPIAPNYSAPANPAAGQQFYFVMVDRFANGDPANDEGGLSGTRLETGYDPADTGFFHGGDLQGVIDHLDYIQGLGTTAIWLTPVFANRPVQGDAGSASAGYHGYWVTDFSRVDPHLGTNGDLKALVAAAHEKGMKVYLDVITNHTADLIQLTDPRGYGGSYVSLQQYPLTAADGTVLDPTVGADTTAYPALDPATSFPYVPERVGGDVTPDCLEPVTRYHNRGDIVWGSEDDEMYRYGDFSGLDDLATEDPAVLECMTGIYEAWQDFGVDGFRVDTGRHVNMEFWTGFTAAMRAHAADNGQEFFDFAEVYLTVPSALAPYVVEGGFDGVLDFAFQKAAVSFAAGGLASELRDLFDKDGVYETATTDARSLVTFLGNHDMGRVGYFLQYQDEALRRDILAHALMFFARGQPVVYYGDEQGFAGTGGDKSARQDLFGNVAPEFVDQKLIDGTVMGTGDHYGTGGLYAAIAELAAVRAGQAALVDGVQVTLAAEYSVFVFARLDEAERTEVIVALNSGKSDSEVTFTSLTPGATYSVAWGGGSPVTAGADGAVTLTVPAIGGVVLVADRAVA